MRRDGSPVSCAGGSARRRAVIEQAGETARRIRAYGGNLPVGEGLRGVGRIS